MAKYAQGTNVSVEKSLAEIQQTLRRYGADGFGYAEFQGQAKVEFQAHKRFIRFIITMPGRHDSEFVHTASRKQVRSADVAYREWEAACRQRWRALALCIKAKLEAVESQISEFENEFMANIVMPDGKTVAEHVGPAIAEAYVSGNVNSMRALGFSPKEE